MLRNISASDPEGLKGTKYFKTSEINKQKTKPRLLTK